MRRGLETKVAPGWVKVLLFFAAAAGLIWWGWLSSREVVSGDPDWVSTRPNSTAETRLAGQTQSNIRQLFVNPLEQAPPSPTDDGVTLRDGDANYYKDE
jgi:hypothetical protein